MNLQTLRYVVTIEQTGSFSKAAQYLFVSQSTLSRSVKELEKTLGMPLFYRTNQGVRPTYDGQKFITKASGILQEVDQLESQYFQNNAVGKASLLLATQRCAAISCVFADYYRRYCAGQEFVNLVIQEKTTGHILQLVGGGTFGLGILHYSSDREDAIVEKCHELQLEGTVFHRSPVVAQVNMRHPLSGKSSVTLEDLAPYPHITYNDENLTGINYCSDISMYSPANQKKRIVIQDRGALRDMLVHTDGYYIGCDYSNFALMDDQHRQYIPIAGIGFTLNTMWVKQIGHTLTKPEQVFLAVLNESYAEMPR